MNHPNIVSPPVANQMNANLMTQTGLLAQQVKPNFAPKFIPKPIVKPKFHIRVGGNVRQPSPLDGVNGGFNVNSSPTATEQSTAAESVPTAKRATGHSLRQSDAAHHANARRQQCEYTRHRPTRYFLTNENAQLRKPTHRRHPQVTKGNDSSRSS